mmetsp:Transcript_55479/g.168639  ORF Transcript_55479/g.168639 Transcript_55479/m.168639 type:complete len:338 (-) Transcript_55479:362-1375(-)
MPARKVNASAYTVGMKVVRMRSFHVAQTWWSPSRSFVKRQRARRLSCNRKHALRCPGSPVGSGKGNNVKTRPSAGSPLMGNAKVVTGTLEHFAPNLTVSGSVQKAPYRSHLRDLTFWPVLGNSVSMSTMSRIFGGAAPGFSRSLWRSAKGSSECLNFSKYVRISLGDIICWPILCPEETPSDVRAISDGVFEPSFHCQSSTFVTHVRNKITSPLVMAASNSWKIRSARLRSKGCLQNEHFFARSADRKEARMIVPGKSLVMSHPNKPWNGAASSGNFFAICSSTKSVCSPKCPLPKSSSGSSMDNLECDNTCSTSVMWKKEREPMPKAPASWTVCRF